jgi:hypothetical protein
MQPASCGFLKIGAAQTASIAIILTKSQPEDQKNSPKTMPGT